MAQFRAFTGMSSPDGVAQLEFAVNEWLTGEQPRILFMSQSPFGSALVVSFLYEAGRGAAALAEAEHAAEVPEIFERTMRETELDPSEDVEMPLPEAELPY